MAQSLTSFLYTVILLGALQGFIMSGLLFFSKKRRYSNRLLGLMILIISLASLNLYASYKNWFGSPVASLLTTLIPLVVIMPLGPLVYFYVQSYLNPGFTISKKQRFHFLPSVIDLVPSLTVITFCTGVIFNWFKNNGSPWGAFIDTFNVYADIPRWASLAIYVFLSARYLSAHKATQATAVTEGQTADYKWLKQVLRAMTVFLGIWFVFLVPYIIPKYSNQLLDAVDWYPLYIPMAIMVYWLGIKGYMASHAVVPEKKAAPTQPALPGELIRQAAVSLERAMQHDKLYLNPNLTLDVLAQHTSFPPKTISAVLNQHIHKSFNEFINSYRVEAFKEKVLLPEMDNLTIAGVAFECGFNSQATFQRTFKQVTGMSPSEFRKSEPILQ